MSRPAPKPTPPREADLHPALAELIDALARKAANEFLAEQRQAHATPASKAA